MRERIQTGYEGFRRGTLLGNFCFRETVLRFYSMHARPLYMSPPRHAISSQHDVLSIRSNYLDDDPAGFVTISGIPTLEDPYFPKYRSKMLLKWIACAHAHAHARAPPRAHASMPVPMPMPISILMLMLVAKPIPVPASASILISISTSTPISVLAPRPVPISPNLAEILYSEYRGDRDI